MASVERDNEVARGAGLKGWYSCGHRYVTPDGRCFHCNADLSSAIAAAVSRLNDSIARELAALR